MKKLNQAFKYANEWHSEQKRKGTTIPYVSHLMSVSALVIENGGDEDQAIAALLHDSLEDAPNDVEASSRKHLIESVFGANVLKYILSCTDGLPSQDGIKGEWKERKVQYIAHLNETDKKTLLIALADKHHNANSILKDLKEVGLSVFERFTTGMLGSMWYYTELAELFERRLPCRLAYELKDVVREIKSLINFLKRLEYSNMPRADVNKLLRQSVGNINTSIYDFEVVCDRTNNE